MIIKYSRFRSSLLLIIIIVFMSACTIISQDAQTINEQTPDTNKKIPTRKSIQEQIDVASPGSVIQIQSGNYDERIIIGKKITLLAVGDVKIRGFIIQADEVTIRGFTITNLTDTGILINTGNSGFIEDNQFLYNGLGGLKFSNATDGWTVRNNLFHRNNLYGAEIKGTNHLIEGNEVTHTIQRHPCMPNVNGADADGFRFHGAGHVFRNNFIHDMPDGKQGYDQISCSEDAVANIENDFDEDSHTDCFQTYDGGSSFEAGHDILFDGNICDLPPAKEWVSWASKAFQGEGNTYNLTFKNNLIIADFLSLFSGGCSNIIFDHNTFVGSNDENSQGLKFIDCVNTAGIVKNNIFIGQRTSVGHLLLINSIVEIGHNCVYLPDRYPFRPPDPGDVWGVDPRLDSNYHLLPDSPCIGAADDGSDIGAFAFSKDFRQ